jgi:hypothetical protein
LTLTGTHTFWPPDIACLKAIFMNQSNNINNVTKPSPDLKSMIEAATGCCLLVLWPGRITEKKEVNLLKQGFRAFLLQQPDQYGRFVELVQRILLTKEYYRLYGLANTAQLASQWLDDGNGFLLSATWFKALEKKRNTIPLYKLEWKALAEALLEITEEGSLELLRYWNNWFRKHNAVAEMLLFHKYIVMRNYDCI